MNNTQITEKIQSKNIDDVDKGLQLWKQNTSTHPIFTIENGKIVLPDWAMQAHHVQYIYLWAIGVLSNTNGTKKTTQLSDSSQLDDTHIIHNPTFHRFPENFKNIHHITKLTVTFGSWTSFPDIFEELPNLERLDVSYNQLTSLPPSIKHCYSLHTLILSNNPIEQLPIELSNCQQLKKLLLREASLTRLPNWMCRLTGLVELHIHDSQLKELPQNLGNLHHLETLICYNTPLTSIPTSISGCIGLRTFDIRSTNIDELPNNISALHCSSDVFLQQGKTKKHSVVYDITSLQVEGLHIEVLEMRSFPFIRDVRLLNSTAYLKNIDLCKELQSLDLRFFSGYQLFDTLPSSLEQLNLMWSHIKSLPDIFSQTKQLRYLNILYTEVQSIPNSLKDRLLEYSYDEEAKEIIWSLTIEADTHIQDHVNSLRWEKILQTDLSLLASDKSKLFLPSMEYIPPTLRHLTQITEISFQGPSPSNCNELSTFPRSLQRLDISKLNLPCFPHKSLREIVEGKISVHNGVMKIDIDIDVHASYSSDLLEMYLDILHQKGLSSELYELDCHNCSRIPNNVHLCSNLKLISIVNSSISEIPETLRSIQTLEDINYKKEQLKRTPPWLPRQKYNWKNIEELKSNCRESSHEILSLRHLELDFAMLSEIPPEIYTCYNLQSLSLKFNRLTTLPEELSRLDKLEFIDIRSNPMKEVPTVLCSLQFLQKIYLPKQILDQKDRIWDVRKHVMINDTKQMASLLENKERE